MTAEVAVANKLAVALAADSKVTVGRGARQKTYDTVNKLFTLSKFHPVGIMIYGNSEFMGFPWETIIKAYRKQLGDRELPTIKDYADDFFRFLSHDLATFTKRDCEENVVSILLDCLLRLGTGPDAIAELEDVLDRYMATLSKRDVLVKTGSIYGVLIKKMIRAVFEDSESIEETSRRRVLRKLLQYCRANIERDVFSTYMSGVVIAGFGESEMFPTVADYKLDGMVAQNLKMKADGIYDATRKSGGFVKGFAQRDMVYRFMEGVDEGYQGYLEGRIVGTLYVRLMGLLDQHVSGTGDEKEAAKERITRDAAEILRDFRAELRKYREERFVEPIVASLDSLPKDELAKLADALVNLTSLNRRVSQDLETVGGAIDVAVISKGDGFIWVRRKHYFDAEYNPTFVGNYLRIK